MTGHNHVTPYPPDMDIAKEYALLCKDEQTRDLVYALINMEYRVINKKIKYYWGSWHSQEFPMDLLPQHI